MFFDCKSPGLCLPQENVSWNAMLMAYSLQLFQALKESAKQVEKKNYPAPDIKFSEVQLP